MRQDDSDLRGCTSFIRLCSGTDTMAYCGSLLPGKGQRNIFRDRGRLAWLLWPTGFKIVACNGLAEDETGK